MPRYSSGTITVTGITVQGTNTAWDNEILVAGDILEVPLATAHIRLEVASVNYVAQTAVLETAYAGPTIDTAAYFVSPENAVQAIKTVALRQTGLSDRYDNLSGLIDASGNIIVGDQFDLIQEAAGNADRAEVAALLALLKAKEATRADLTTDLGAYVDGDVILVEADETNSGYPTLYQIEGGSPVQSFSPATSAQVADVAAKVTYAVANFAALSTVSASQAPIGTLVRRLDTNDYYDVISNSSSESSVIQGVDVKLSPRPGDAGYIPCTAFGCTGISGDDQDTALVLAATSNIPVSFGFGAYDFTTSLEPQARWVGVDHGIRNQAITDGVEFRFFGAGQAITTQHGVEHVALRSMAAGQSGLLLRAGIGTHNTSMRIFDFDGVGLDIGIAGFSGAYFINVAGIEVNNFTRVGQIGFRVSGSGPVPPNSNNNYIQCPFVKGLWQRYFDLSGNGNIIIGGTAEPNKAAVVAAGSAITEVVRVFGIGNVWKLPYLEPVGADTNLRMFHFTPESIGNKMENIYSPSWRQPAGQILDEGTANEVDIVPTGFNFTPPVGLSRSFQNLIPNASFKNLKANGLPVGWVSSTPAGTAIARDTSITRGTAHSMRVDVSAAERAELNCWISANSTNPVGRGPLSRFKAEKLAGKTVTAGVWAWTTTAEMGNITVFQGNGYVGTANHSGSGEWEFLSVQVRLEDTATEFGVGLRSSASNSNIQGTVWFSEPVLVFGSQVPQVPEPRALTDDEAVMAGRLIHSPAIEVTDGATVIDVTEGNVFVLGNTSATTVTALTGVPDGLGAQIIKLISTNGNTTLNSTSSVRLTGGASRTLAAYEAVELVYVSNLSKWVEV